MSVEAARGERLLDRRSLLKSGVALAAGGLVLGVSLSGCDRPSGGGAPRDIKSVATNAWLRIGTDDSITFLCDRSEMGQGVYTSLAMLIAEELGVNLGRIRVEFAPPGAIYTNSLIGAQVTGGSTSIRDAWEKLRKAGAQAREMLVAAACKEWGIANTGARVEDGVIISNHGKRLSFGAVAEAAAQLPVPAEPKTSKRPLGHAVGSAVPEPAGSSPLRHQTHRRSYVLQNVLHCGSKSHESTMRAIRVLP